MAKGTVKFFNNKKGFGFIVPENGGTDIFVHVSALENSGVDGLNEGQKVSYELGTDRQGRPNAIDLRVA
jgi:cold shock protein